MGLHISQLPREAPNPEALTARPALQVHQLLLKFCILPCKRDLVRSRQAGKVGQEGGVNLVLLCCNLEA